MIVSMDLNASPVPEEDEDIFEEKIHVEEFHEPEERIETGADIARREREERKRRLKRERPDDRPVHVSQSPGYDQLFHTKNQRSYDKSRLPPGYGSRETWGVHGICNGHGGISLEKKEAKGLGWLDCPSSGQEICCMIPSKVPLGESFNDCIPPGKRYSFKQVIHQQRVLGRKLGLVIDLTNTTRYYPVSDLKKECIKHVKIQCRGRDSVPDNLSVNQFVYEVTQFLSRQKHSKKYILVHCTHGHNRTGYMIIHYLMRAMSMSVTQAIKIFSEARPPGIYKPDYIDALYSFYHEKKPEMVVCPPTPEWKRSSEFDLNGEAVPDDDDDGVPGPDLHENHETDTRMTNDDVLGDEIPTDQQDALRQFCYQTLKLGVGARGHTQFPGSHPVSLNRDNLQLLRQRYYYATWKADGTRYMMLITMDGCYLIDRSFNFRRVQMRFPCRSTNDGLGEKTHHFTLLDGEMVIDTLPDSQKQERRYLIYDLMAINQVSVIEVRRKDFWLLSTVTKLLKEFIKRLSHEADGLIFQGWDDPYIPRTHEGLLKWKYAYLNSVDFLFEVDGDRELLFLYERGKKKLLEGNRVEFTDGSDPSLYSGKIIECSWDFDKLEWKFMRIRTDKSTPNEFNTYRKVMRSIRDNITEEDLLNEISEIIRLPMYADRIRIDSKANQHANVARRR
ncbi:mRNA-capping enzyme [Glycine max]|nr:mRNA-capping enzyme [Glycine max]KAH1265812.1 mRNA-capping enzyme [Glycine max]KAH1265813.1 mRNA-capping enzyme [Glycine max]KAH1265814.1 mRNA-capping enzyme [Glycine max]